MVDYRIYDIAGNVQEWCTDWYGADYYRNSPAKNPPGPGRGSSRVLRGGSWNSLTYRLRVARRFNDFPSNRTISRGFRCVSATVENRVQGLRYEWEAPEQELEFTVKLNPKPPYSITVGQELQIHFHPSRKAVILPRQIPANANFIADGRTLNWQPTRTQVGSSDFQFYAITEDNLSQPISFSVTVVSY